MTSGLIKFVRPPSPPTPPFGRFRVSDSRLKGRRTVESQRCGGRNLHRTAFAATIIAASLSHDCPADTATLTNGSKSPTPTAMQWTTYRGNHRFNGLAAGNWTPPFELKWKFKTNEPVKSSAVVANRIVFIGSDDAHIYAVDLDTGKLRWARKTGGPIEAPPLLVEDRVIIGSDDGILYAISAGSGEIIWTYETGGRIVGSANWSPSEPSNPHGSILFGSYDNFLYCLDAKSGKLQWKFGTDNYINGAAAIADGQAVFGGCDGFVYAIAVETGQVQARVELGSPIAGTAGLADGFAYIGHYGNQFVRINLANEQIDWTFEDRQFPFFSSPAISRKRTVFGSRSKRVYCVSRDDGKLIWTFPTRGKVDSSPVICGDKVVTGSDDGRLYVLGLDKGEEIWSYQIGEAITSSPAVAGNIIVIGSEDGSVYAFGPKTPPAFPENADAQ